MSLFGLFLTDDHLDLDLIEQIVCWTDMTGAHELMCVHSLMLHVEEMSESVL